jgi:hypothetical protein
MEREDAFLETMRTVLRDAMGKLDAEAAKIKSGTHQFSDLNIYSWPQQWPDATCGFPGAGGQAVTTAQTILVESYLTGAWVVYIRGKFAYLVIHPNERFFHYFSIKQMPGVTTSASRNMEKK